MQFPRDSVPGEVGDYALYMIGMLKIQNFTHFALRHEARRVDLLPANTVTGVCLFAKRLRAR